MTYASANFKDATFNGLGKWCIYKEIHYLTLTLPLGTSRWPIELHHVAFASAEFEVAMSNGLGGDGFTRKYNI